MSPKKYKPFVAIDTQILIYFYLEVFPSEFHEDISRRARALIQDVKDDNSQICISIITLAEYLVKVDDDKKDATAIAIMDSFDIAPFNVRASIETSKLVPLSKTLISGDRPILLADTKILGSIAAKSGCEFVTADEKLYKLGSAIKTLKTTMLPEQFSLFDNLDE